MMAVVASRHVRGGPDTTGGQDVAILFATRTGHVVLGFLIQATLAYTLLPEGRGAYSVCVVFGSLLGLVFSPGAQQGAQYFVAARQASVSQGVGAAAAISLAGGGLAIALAIPLIDSDVAFFQKAETRSFHLGLVLAPLVALSTAIEHLLAALRRFGRLAVRVLLRMSVNAIAILVLVRWWGLGVDGAVASFAIGHLVSVAACLGDLRRHCGLVAEVPSRSALTRILGYGLRYHMARLGNALEPHAGVLVLGLIASPAEIGLFAAASTLMLGFTFLSHAVGNALLPRIAGRDQPELVARCLRLVGWTTAVGVLPALAVGTPLVSLLLSASFLPVVPLLWILAPGIVASAGTGLFMTHFKGVDRPEICSWATCLGLCANLGVLFPLYPRLGIEAAAWAMTTGAISCCLFLAIVFRRTTGMGWLPICLPARSDAGFLWTAGRSALGRRGEVPRPTPLVGESRGVPG